MLTILTSSDIVPFVYVLDRAALACTIRAIIIPAEKLFYSALIELREQI
jgi:hypothetical protein